MNKSLIPRPLITAFLVVTAAFVSGSQACAQEDYLQYPSVTFPYEESNAGVDFFNMYKTAGVMTSLARATLPHVLDLAYGNDVKQRLDIYLPVEKPAHAPVFLFIHGGAFEEGDRAYYGYVAKPLAAHGIITVVMSYRLVGRDPHNKIDYADQEDDAKHAIIWIYRNVAHYGGDPNRIYIGGHSAGGVLVGDLGVDRAWLTKAGIPESVICGVAQLSGGFKDMSADDGTPGASTAELRRLMSPIRHIVSPAPRFVLASGEKEISGSGWIRAKDIAQLRDALEKKGAHVAVAMQPGADHSAAVLALNDEYSPETQAILRMILDSSFP